MSYFMYAHKISSCRGELTKAKQFTFLKSKPEANASGFDFIALRPQSEIIVVQQYLVPFRTVGHR